MKRSEGNIGESEKTSVKVHHAPGGQSNFSLGWGNDVAPPQQKGKYHNQSSIVFGEEPQKPVQQKNEPKQADTPVIQQPKTTQVQPQTQQTTPAYEAPKASVKVHNPPGGKSSITFG